MSAPRKNECAQKINRNMNEEETEDTNWPKFGSKRRSQEDCPFFSDSRILETEILRKYPGEMRPPKRESWRKKSADMNEWIGIWMNEWIWNWPNTKISRLEEAQRKPEEIPKKPDQTRRRLEASRRRPTQEVESRADSLFRWGGCDGVGHCPVLHHFPDTQIRPINQDSQWKPNTNESN